MLSTTFLYFDNIINRKFFFSRVDVNRSESANSQERVIVIRGQLENCTQACREILRIMYEDAKTKNKTQ